jgi:formylglycine-generating enzyme required for sulfatase activity
MSRFKPEPAGDTADVLSRGEQTVMLSSAETPAEGTVSRSDTLLSSGVILRGRFRLLQKIGEGGMSRVYRAIDLRQVEAGATDPHVAVKVLTVPFANHAEAMTLLAREAHSLRCVTHPNIVRVIDCDRDGDIVFMTLELLSGQSLFDKLRPMQSTGMPRAMVHGIVKGIAEALDFAHAKNIVHGDLKPGNVIITDSGEPKVIDFGLARLGELQTHTHRSHRSASDWTALTPAYASPQMLERGPPDPRDDVFALACTTWMLMTGEHPFKGKSLTAARGEGIELLSSGKLSTHEFRALRHALEFDRERRTPSARQFLAEFSRTDRPRQRWPLLAVAALGTIVLLGGLAVAAYFAFKPPSNSSVTVTIPKALSTTPVQTLAAGTVFRDCPACPQMKVLPSGAFLQGSVAGDPGVQRFELPQHNVSIFRPFAAGIYDVTVGEYAQFVADTGYEAHSCTIYDGSWHESSAVSWRNATDSQTPLHPVTCVSWQDAKQYASWLSHRTGRSYRLPSASEWEYLARAGSTAPQPWTDPHAACSYANVADQTASQHYPGWTVQPCVDGYAQSSPVGAFAPNTFGLYDTLGNVFQWVDDCWADDYVGAPSDGSARIDGDCAQRELRGGSWFSRPDYVRASYRNRFPTDYRSTTVGFRLVRDITP